MLLLSKDEETEAQRDKVSFPVSSRLLRLLSGFSRVRLFATPWTAASEAPPSMGFSRQEYWSGVPLPAEIKLEPRAGRLLVLPSSG